MKERFKWKKVLSVLLSAAMVAGLIGVAGPKQANAADANMLTNGGFDNASEAWKDQDGTLVGAQTVVDDVIRTEYMKNGDFEGETTNYNSGNSANATIAEGEGLDGSRALKFTRADESATSHPYVWFTPTGLDTTGTVTYTLSFKLRSTGAHWQGYIVENGDTADWGAIGWTAADNTWTEYKYTFVTTTGTAQIGIQAVQGSGDIYIDNLSIYTEKTEEAVERQEKIVNGDFEGETTNYNSGNSANATIVEGEGVDESRALKFTRADESATSHPYIWFTPTGLDTTGTVTYTLTFKLRSTGAHWQGYIVENGDTANWGAIGWTAADNTWTEYKYTFVTTTGTAQIGIQAVQGSGDIYIDNLSIYTEEKVKVQDDKFTGGNFEGAVSYNQGNAANATIVEGEGVDGSKALKFTRADASATSHPYIWFTPTGLDTTGTVTYTLSFKLRSTGAHWQGYIVENGSTADWGAIGWTAADNTWTEYKFTFVTTTGTAQIGIQAVQGSGDIYIDDFRVCSEKNKLVQTYTEGIGTCNEAEPDNVLAMKDYTKVTQDVTIKKGNRYDYSFMVKSENAGEDLAFGVTAGDNTTDAVTVTSDWKEVTGSFTAIADATEFGFTRGGTGTVLIDDVVLNETVTGPTDHTSMPGGGAYVPEGHINLLSGAMSDFSSDADYSLNGVGVIENDMLKITASGVGNVQTPGIEVVANETYTFSFYAWVQNTVGDLAFNVYFTGAGTGWKDNACETSLSADTEGWTLLTCEVKPTETGTVYFGLKNYGEGSGTIYVDDLALTKAKKVVEDHTTMENGGNKLPVGATNLISNGDFSAEGDLGNGVTAKNGIASWSAKNSNYYQVGIQATKGHSYKVSYFVQICEASSVSYDMFMSGDGSPTGGWKDNVLSDSATIANISDSTHSASITGDTSGWELVEYTWTAPADGTANIGFKSYNSDAVATIYLDDLVVYDTNYKATDHTSMEGGGYYISLEDAVNLNTVGDLSGSTGWNGSGVTYQDGMASVNAAGKYLQTQQFSLTAGHTYTMSAYVWVTNVDSSITFDCFSDGAAAPGGGWTDFGMAQWSGKGATCNRAASLTGNTYGWELVTLTWTAPATGICYFGFKIYDGAGTVYMDDVALYDHAVPEFVNVELSYAGSEYANNDFTIYVDNNLTAEEWSTNYPSSAGTIYKAGSVWINDVEYTGVNYFFDTNNKKITLWNVATNSGVNPADITKVEIKAGTKLAFSSYKMAKITKGFIIEKNAYGQWVDPSNTNFGDPATLTFGWFDYYATKTAALNGMPASSGSYVALSGAVRVNGVNYGATFTHNETSATIDFSSGSLQDVLSETEVNTVVIPKDLVLYDGLNAVCHVASDVVFYVQKKQGEWLSWTSEYTYQGGNVLYYDMGTAGAKYVFNNNADATYMGVLAVSGKDTFVMGGQTNASREVTALGDYNVSRTIKGEKYDYTVALYQRGDADKTMDGQLTSLDLVAAKKAVGANEATFGHARYKAADSNTDGVVDEKDAAFMRRVLANDFEIHKTTSKGYSTLGQGVMPIIGYGGPSDDTTKTNQDVKKRSTQGGVDNLLDGEAGERVFGLVRELGINVFSSQVHEVGGDYETSTRMLKMAEKYGLGVYVNNAYVSGSDTVAAQLSQQTAKYESFGSFHGYYVADEPGKNAIGNYTTQLTALKNHANIASYFNLKPNWGSNFTGNQYNTYLSTAFGTDAEAVSYDLYLRSKTYLLTGFKQRTADFYKNLDQARTASMNVNKPFQAFVQTGANWIDNTSTDRVDSSNRLTIQEMYLEANAALAMGAKGIHYFNLIESVKQVEKGDNDSGLITIKGEANNNEGGDYDYYNAAKKINTYIAKVDEVLMNATSKGVIPSSTIKSYLSGANTNLTSYGAVTSVEGSNALVGCFDYYGKNAYMVVNTSTSASETITLHMADTTSYTYTGMDCDSKAGSGTLPLNLGAGESVLVVVD